MHDFDGTQKEHDSEMGTFESEQFEYGETGWSGEVFGEAELMELAAELLEVRDEAELDRFLGDLIKKAGRAIGSVVRSPVGQAVGGILKGAAKKALPLAGAALGGWVGGPLGAKVGSGLASMAGQALGLELEGLSQEDREFEAAKQFVRFAGETVKKAASAPPSVAPPTVAQRAAVSAAQQHAPGLLRGAAGTIPPGIAGRARTGRWIRRGRNVIIVNC